MTVTMTADEFSKSGLFDDSRRLPFTDDMILAIDKDLKWETRRPIKYNSMGKRCKCPYGEVGTLLLVTGSHVFLDFDRRLKTELYSHNYNGEGLTTLYRCDYINEISKNWFGCPIIENRDWRPPMFMPKWAPNRYLISRAVEQTVLTDITDDQTIAEGVEVLNRGDGQQAQYTFHGSNKIYPSAVQAFEHGWNSIHGERGLYFHKGPEVWRIVFERLVIE